MGFNRISALLWWMAHQQVQWNIWNAFSFPQRDLLCPLSVHSDCSTVDYHSLSVVGKKMSIQVVVCLIYSLNCETGFLIHFIIYEMGMYLVCVLINLSALANVCSWLHTDSKKTGRLGQLLSKLFAKLRGKSWEPTQTQSASSSLISSKLIFKVILVAGIAAGWQYYSGWPPEEPSKRYSLVQYVLKKLQSQIFKEKFSMIDSARPGFNQFCIIFKWITDNTSATHCQPLNYLIKFKKYKSFLGLHWILDSFMSCQ